MRIRGAAGSVLGAGMVLCTGHVLTCAHVVAESGGEQPGRSAAPLRAPVGIEFCGLPGVPAARGWVAEGGWFPPLADGRGDVALLQLDRAQPDGSAAPLRRVPATPHRSVRMFGFPDGIETGEWVAASLLGDGGPAGEWVQMNGTPDMRVRRGFSGAGVVDDVTSSVIGMVVTAHTDPARTVSWMLPVETIVRYAPRVDECVRGDSAVERSLAGGFDVEPLDPDLARRLASWLGGRGSGGVLILVTGDRGSSQAATLRRALVLGDRGLRPEAAVHAPADTVPPVGSVDLAIDAAGKTIEEVSRRIVDRFGIPGDESTDLSDRVLDDPPPMTLIVDAVDDAVQPEALVTRVLAPLAERAAARDIRLLIGFRRAASLGMRVLVEQRLDRLEARVAEVGAAEAAARRVAADAMPRVADAPEAPDRSGTLRLRVTALRRAARDPDAQWLLAELDLHENAVERALGDATAVGRRLAGMLDQHRELRGSLDAYRALSADHGLVEDIELGALQLEAEQAVRRRPCDLAAAAELVRRYILAVRTRAGERDRGTGA